SGIGILYATDRAARGAVLLREKGRDAGSCPGKAGSHLNENIEHGLSISRSHLINRREPLFSMGRGSACAAPSAWVGGPLARPPPLGRPTEESSRILREAARRRARIRLMR